jgi:hypothetical protein
MEKRTNERDLGMKKVLPLGVALLFIGLTAVFVWTLSGNQVRGDNEHIKDRFVGAWRLAWLEEPDADGKIHKADCTGQLVYTRDSHMSVQVMYRNPQTGGQVAPVQYAQGGYEASFGTYRINQNGRTFTFYVEGAMVRSLIGKDLPRAFELSDNQLIVKPTNPNEQWRVAWERY